MSCGCSLVAALDAITSNQFLVVKTNATNFSLSVSQEPRRNVCNLVTSEAQYIQVCTTTTHDNIYICLCISTLLSYSTKYITRKVYPDISLQQKFIEGIL